LLAAKRSSFPGFRNNLEWRKRSWEHLALDKKPDQKHRYEILKVESFLPKFTLRTILLLALLLFGGVNGAHAQRLSAYFGLGGAKDRAGTTSNSTNACLTGQLFDGLICEPGPKIGGLFGVFGVDVRFKRHLGINAEYTFHFKKVPFLPDDSLNMRPAFYDVNVMWMRVAGNRIAPLLEGGAGGARLGLRSTSTTPITGITNTSSFSAGSRPNHAQLHFGAGLKFYVRGNIFIKPQFDLHYVFNFKDQFGRNLVPEYTGSLGYTFGGR
jgi:hypothetical protein